MFVPTQYVCMGLVCVLCVCVCTRGTVYNGCASVLCTLCLILSLALKP